MSVATELQRIIDAKADLKTAIEAKGVTVSSSALIDTYASLVDSIPSGGGTSVEEKLVNFIDYDGTIVASYTGVEAQALTALPNAPDHSTDTVPLTFDEWNWTLSEIKTYNTSYPDGMIVVGANYHTTDGKIHLLYEITSDTDGNGVQFTPGTHGGSYSGTVDWGDNSPTESITSAAALNHIYQNIGIYHCVIDSTMDYMPIGGFSSSNRVFTSKLKRAWFPSTITTLSTYNFKDCYSLQSVSIAKNTSLATACFQDCRALQGIVVPKRTINTISSESFFGCKSLRYISIPFNTDLGSSNAFRDCSALQNLTSNKSTSSQIGTRYFYGCSSLTKIDIPNEITFIADSSFADCWSLQTIIIPSSVTYIGSSAFSNCYSMYSVVLLSTTPPTLSSSNAFSTSNQKKFYVPYSADHSVLDTYKTASNWSTYASYMEELPQ